MVKHIVLYTLKEGVVLLLVHGAVDLVGVAPVIAALPPGLLHVDGFVGHEGGGGIEEMQLLLVAEIAADGLGHGITGQGAGGDDDGTLGDLGDLPVGDGDIGMVLDLVGDHLRKAVTVHGQGAAGFHSGGLGALHDDAVQTAQLLL